MDTPLETTVLSAVQASVLPQYRGKWIAVSADGERVVAVADDLVALDQAVVAAGEDPERVGFVRIGSEEPFLGGAELL